MNLGIVSSHNFNNYNVLHTVIQKYFITWDIDNIISGEGSTNTLAEKYADQYNITKVTSVMDDIWINSDIVLSFWDTKSTDTQHYFELSKKYKKDFLVVEYLNKKVYWFDREDTISSTYYSKPEIPSISW